MLRMNLGLFTVFANVEIFANNAVIANAYNGAHLASVADNILVNDLGLSFLLLFLMFLV